MASVSPSQDPDPTDSPSKQQQQMARRRSTENGNSPPRDAEYARMEVDEEEVEEPNEQNLSRVTNVDLEEFHDLVSFYTQHIQMMRLSFCSTEQQFLADHCDGSSLTLRKMEPTDIQKLSEVDLCGLFYWILKQDPYSQLPPNERSVLLKRYSLRKLSLDHYYSASQHPEYVLRREFVMNNNTFVPSVPTDFELPSEDMTQIEAGKKMFGETFNCFWTKIIDPFVQLKMTDAEIVFLHVMLLWSTTNDERVSIGTRQGMEKRQAWVKKQLSDWYEDQNIEKKEERLQKMLGLLGEIESICDMYWLHFQVVQLFEFCDMSRFWYETLCYSPCNLDPYLVENFRVFNTIREPNDENHDRSEQENNVEIAEDPALGLLDNLDPALLAVNAHLLPQVMAPLPPRRFVEDYNINTCATCKEDVETEEHVCKKAPLPDDEAPPFP